VKLKDTNETFATSLKGAGIRATMGGDPEFFVADGKGKILASDKFFPGKEKPIKFIGAAATERAYGILKLFFDGIQAEMNIGVQQCREGATLNVHTCLQKAINIIEKENKDCQIILKPAVKVTKAVIKSADPEARRFGCMPDFNAYTLTTNTDEIDATNHPYRYAGGHIHLGVSSPYVKRSSKEGKMAKTEEGHLRIIRLLDLIVGIPCVLLDNSAEAKIRRAEYGKAGCFRPTPYGVEYRTPSCWWIKSPTTVSLILGLARLAWTIAGKSQDLKLFNLLNCKPADVRGIIDESDRKVAVELWEKVRPYIAIIGRAYNNPLHIRTVRSPDVVFGPERWSERSGKFIKVKGSAVFSLAVFEYMVKNGLESLISDNVKKEWKLNTKGFNSMNGFVNEMHKRLFKDKDFMNFQNDFLKQII